ncbi:histidine kinase [Thermoleophilia bacterium SCSIO 60948]|nr:histidine kinase [Thermoleophilia bacterium SCSIO 60948]
MAGRHKIFLGMAAGVGKTYRALGETRSAVEDGVDAVVAILETHGRAATAAAAEGLEVLPRLEVAYRGATLSELDLDAVLRRAPDLCLVDELAHTNAPGMRHAKRFEDVESILDAQIDVLSTVNVQHLESLNDQVAELTGVRVRETLPDEALSKADEVVLVDLTPEALIERLREGRIYPAERIGPSLGGFFRIENLQALREVALRQVAEDVEAKRMRSESLARREERLFGSVPAPIADRLLAIVGLDPEAAEPVVRRAWRSAQRLAAELDILVVREPEAEPTAAERDGLERLRRLSASLGATLLIESGDEVAEVAARVAADRGSTYLLIGRQSPRRGLARLSDPLTERLLRRLPDVDLRIVS